MKYKLLLFLSIILFLINCSCKKNISQHGKYEVKVDTLTMFDKTRNRKVPIAFFSPKTNKKIIKQQVVIFSHGYGANKGGDYMIYSYLTKDLALRGYFVVSIQHELPTDELIPTEGKPQIVRMPFWERGAENILFVLNELEKIKPELDYKHLTLIGHSNGADMTALFANKYPNLVYKIITMDNRRMYLPRTSVPKIYTLRSNDYPADEGVLPTAEEQKRFNITVQATNINHGKMDDKGNDTEKNTLIFFIERYLNEK
ncbi:putative esterase [Chryseobacterium ginsenosidimutans]|uniref:alpha/beta hydrolase family protein n=1 Tax=Chryseobacterium ginsenosidimutans TaxID=687846 RepID=UPI00278901D7|nr:alpha/beta hydrolase [Chryseobacterium ginsenosidimutans]MDQ0594359.1 putative esterase [Chryseobacterium ginsenosidimutans]